MNKRINGTLRTGFTLAELLVVIVIIVLLPAILIPAIQQNSEQHKNIICRDNVKQWGLMLAMYTNDNNGHFMPGFNVRQGMWMIKLRPYGTDSNNIRLCPKATKLLSTTGLIPDSFTAWGVYGDPGYNNWTPAYGAPGLYGSYGMNEWASDPHDPMQPGDLYQINPDDLPHYWRTIYQKNPNTIPVLGDSVWEGTKVFYIDEPPAVPGVAPAGALWGMWNFCLPRHQSGNEYTVNLVFMDISARKVPIKQLWKLKWSPLFRTDRNITRWPAWITPP